MRQNPLVRQTNYPDGQAIVIVKGERAVELANVGIEGESLVTDVESAEVVPLDTLSKEEAQASHDLLKSWIGVECNDEIGEFLENLRNEQRTDVHANLLCGALTRWPKQGPTWMREKCSENSEESRSFTSKIALKRLDLLNTTSSSLRLQKAHVLIRAEMQTE